MAVDLGAPGTGVVVTGGASGIGRASALALAEVGRAVSVWDIDADKARETAEECAKTYGVPVHALGIDMRDRAAIAAGAPLAVEALGTVGGIVHAAGISGSDPSDALGTELWDDVMAVNLRAEVDLVKALLPALRAAGPGSAVVGIASIEALVGHGSITAYTSSKHGLLGLTRSLSHKLGPEGLRVNCVCPGYVETPMLARALTMPGARDRMEGQVSLKRLATPEDIAMAVRFLLSTQAAYVNGVALTVDGGWTASGGQ